MERNSSTLKRNDASQHSCIYHNFIGQYFLIKYTAGICRCLLLDLLDFTHSLLIFKIMTEHCILSVICFLVDIEITL
jgi:hypothetical protein